MRSTIQFYIPKKIRHPIFLAIPKFNHNFPAGAQESAGFGRQVPIKVQPVRTAIQRTAGVVISDLRLEFIEFQSRNVRRVGRNQIKATRIRQR